MEDAEKLKSHVGRRIAELRERHGLTQANVAEAIGTTVPNLQRIEYGTQNVTLETLVRIANAIGVRVVEMFEEELEGPKKKRTRGRPRR
ncbi:MAG: helix-turn-helix transcriptional regulator [Labilithrix sp.]|nr:helix-turn-helix transcriptional regulator [Labilithrix sp.]